MGKPLTIQITEMGGGGPYRLQLAQYSRYAELISIVEPFLRHTPDG